MMINLVSLLWSFVAPWLSLGRLSGYAAYIGAVLLEPSLIGGAPRLRTIERWVAGSATVLGLCIFGYLLTCVLAMLLGFILDLLIASLAQYDFLYKLDAAHATSQTSNYLATILAGVCVLIGFLSALKVCDRIVDHAAIPALIRLVKDGDRTKRWRAYGYWFVNIAAVTQIWAQN